MTVVKKFRIWCITENKWVEGFGKNTPTACYNNNTHTINVNSVQELEVISDTIVQIQEETIPTGKNFGTETISIDIPAGATGSITIKDHCFPFPISLLNTFYTTKEYNDGDLIEAQVGPQTTIGLFPYGITAGITTGITVSSTVLSYLNIGYWVDITNGITSHNLGRCLSIDKVNSQITLENSSPINYANNSILNQTVKMMHDYYLVGNETKYLGTNKIGASYVPSHTVGRVVYKNMDGKAKKFIFGLEYLY